MSKGIPYSQHVRPRTQVMDVSRAMFGVPVSPLVDVVAPRLGELPGDIGAQLKRDFWKRHDADGEWSTKYAAQDWLASQVAEFQREKIHRAFDEEEIRALAKRWSDLCMRMVRLEPMQEFARSVGIEPPEVKGNVSRCGAARRLSCARWWRRQIRKHYTRRAESHLRARGFVHQRRQVYASDRCIENHRERRRRNSDLLRDLVAVSDAGDQLELLGVVEHSQANPALRRAELMTRLRGFEEVARAAGHVAEFITLTCASAFHRTHVNGTQNDQWRGFTPREGQQWLCRMWARARAKLARLSIRFYGFRIAEPHHDGTPHWHLVLFSTEAAAETMRRVLGGIWLSEYGDEAGAAKHRASFKRIDPAKGSAAGYLAKYVAKNIDGFEVGDDYETEGQSAADSCARVSAWAAAHGVRQFQQIGGPSVCVWRELRRLGDRAIPVQAIEDARKAADAGEWADFVAALGGIERGRRGHVQLWSECTGELSQYDEVRGPQIAGVQCVQMSSVSRSTVVDMSPVRVRTRCKVWRIQRKDRSAANSLRAQLTAKAWKHTDDTGPRSDSPLGPVSITVRGATVVPSDASTGAHRSGRIRGSPWTH